MGRDALIAEIIGASAVAFACTAGCGPEPPAGATDGGSGSGTPTGDATGTASTDAPTEPTTSGTGTGGDEPALPEACALVRVPGDARVPLTTFVLGSPRLSVLEPGAPGVPPRVMTVQLETSGSAHENFRARAFTLDSWPGGVAESALDLKLTRNGHSMSRLVELAGSPRRFAYVWTGDPGGTNSYDTFFSILDVDAWKVGGEVEIESSTNPQFVDLQPAATPERLVVTYTSESYDTLMPDELSGFSLGILDGAGDTVVGATPLTLRTPEPGSSLRTYWAGDRVAAAMGHNGCRPEDELCVPHSVVLARPTAPDEHGAAVDGFEFVRVVDGLVGTKYVSRPQVSPRFGLSFVSWYEGDNWTSSDEHRTFRGMVLDAGGAPIPWPPVDPAPGPISFMADTNMASWPTLLVSDFGITVAYRTVDKFFEIRHHDFAFAPLGEPIAIELPPDLADLPHYPSMAVLNEPSSLLLAWEEEVASEFTMRMVRLECAG